MMGMNPRSCSRITLVISLASTISTLVLLLAALGLPWYTPLEFTSTTSGWDCHLTILRSPIYGYKTCDCPATPLSFTLCDEHNFYQWRNCIDCREPGCACTQEQRVWNGTLFTNCLSIILTCVCIVLLSSQFKATKPGISSYWILMLFQCLNAFIILNCALFFLTINHAIKGDSGDWCEQRGVTIGACNSLAGSNTGTFFYQNHQYSFSTEWGVAAGWIMALAAGAFSIVATGSTFTFCVLRWKSDRDYETM